MKELNWRDILTRTALILATVIIVVWTMPRDNRSYFHVEEGKPWKYADFTAPYDFPIYKSQATIKEETDSVMRLYEPYYKYSIEQEAQLVKKFNTDYADGLPGLPPSFKTVISNRLRSLYQQGIMDQKDYTELRSDTTNSIQVVHGKQSIGVSIMEVYSPKTAYEQLFMEEQLAQQRPLLQKCNLNNYIAPNLIYDRERSEASKSDLMAGIALASGLVQKGEKIVDRGELVTARTYRIIESFKRENELRNDTDKQNQLTLFGQIVYTALIMIAFTLYLSLYRKDYFEKPRSITMLYALIVLFAILTAIFVRNTFIHVYILPYAMVPIFIRVFMDSRTAFMTHVTMVLICAVMLQHPFEFIVIETIAGLVAITSLRELSERSQLFKTAIIVTVACMTANLAFDWMHADALTQIDYSTYHYLIANGIALLFAYPLLYLIEKTFGFTSDITLIELSNTNNELLRRMSEIAPGTFNHSIQVANLAGEIANKIGAKAQLVRTGALYHDIGKLSNPIYFTENQSSINPHETLTDIESAQIIISHVTEGLKMADKHNLPQVIRDFISTHHGLGKAKFFYVHYHNEHPNEPVDDLLFTYPGPNPFTREQACLMMADTVEAASRSLPDYTEKSIRSLVERLIDGQVADGFYRECPITFRDIQYAKTVLIEKLKTVYHTRISYPSEKK
ncbi:MAG: HDIG domain-containing protein [Prevotella sp.]|nr:HDIG domain-containing protein [Prevotella sp.]MBQ9203107.1 HDIG domain-containing protein [Prevotella sp.]